MVLCYIEHMEPKELLTEFRYCAQHFNKDEYPALYERVKNAATAFLTEAEGTDTAAHAAALLDEVESAAEVHRFNFRRAAAIADDKLVLVLFVVPALVGIGTPAALGFADQIAAEWKARFPGEDFGVGNYDDIASGFRSWKSILGRK